MERMFQLDWVLNYWVEDRLTRLDKKSIRQYLWILLVEYVSIRYKLVNVFWAVGKSARLETVIGTEKINQAFLGKCENGILCNLKRGCSVTIFLLEAFFHFALLWEVLTRKKKHLHFGISIKCMF